MRFVLVDRIIELVPGASITAEKNLTLAEEYLQDHFPGFPVMPGVLMLEGLVQTGAWLMRDAEAFRFSTILLKQVRAVRYNNFVAPGKTLRLSMTVKTRGESCWEFQGAGTVDGESTVNAKITLAQFNLADRDPALAKSDELRRDFFRGLYSQVYSPKAVSQQI